MDRGESLDYHIPHIEGRVGLVEGEAYLDPVEGRSVRESLLVGESNEGQKIRTETGTVNGTCDIDKLVPHADDQVHFVKETISRIDSVVPHSEYQMNYVTQPSKPDIPVSNPRLNSSMDQPPSLPRRHSAIPGAAGSNLSLDQMNRSPPRRGSAFLARGPEVTGSNTVMSSVPRKGGSEEEESQVPLPPKRSSSVTTAQRDPSSNTAPAVNGLKKYGPPPPKRISSKSVAGSTPALNISDLAPPPVARRQGSVDGGRSRTKPDAVSTAVVKNGGVSKRYSLNVENGVEVETSKPRIKSSRVEKDSTKEESQSATEKKSSLENALKDNSNLSDVIVQNGSSKKIKSSRSSSEAGNGALIDGNDSTSEFGHSLERRSEHTGRSSTRRSKPSELMTSRSASVPPKEDFYTSGAGSLRRKKKTTTTYPVETILIDKQGGSLGLSVVGGVDQCSHPFGITEPGIFVSKVVSTGSASRTTIRVGDRILSVNGVDVRSAKHDEAVELLCSQTNQVTLEVRKDPQPKGLQEIKLTKKEGEKLGLSIRGGLGNQNGNPADPSDDGIFISKISPDGAVARDGRVQPGMRILEVNGRSLLSCSHHEAVNILRSVVDELHITICHGYNPHHHSIITSLSVTESFNNARLSSLSSFDRDFDDSGISVRNTSTSISRFSSLDDDTDDKPIRRPRPPVPVKPNKFRKGSLNSIPSAVQHSNQSGLSRSSYVSGSSQSGVSRSAYVSGSLNDVRTQNPSTVSKTPMRAKGGEIYSTGSLKSKKRSSRLSSGSTYNTDSIPRKHPNNNVVFQKLG